MSNTKTEAQRLAEFKDLEYWPAGVGLTDWVESACAEMLRLDAALADELNNRDVLDKMLTQCITERDQLRAQVERLQGGEPVAWRVRRHDAPKYWIVFLHKPVDALQDPDREVQPLYTPAAPSQEPAVPQGWTDADSDAARLALELECLLLDTENLSVVSKWWASANEALELHRRRLATPAAPSQDPYKDSTPHLSEKEALR